MDWSIPLTAFIAFFGTLSVLSKVLAWAVIVHGLIRPKQPVGASLAPLLLHSGPWLLVGFAASIYYLATHARPTVFWAAVAGVTVGVAFVVAMSIYARFRSRRQLNATVPLTPERLASIRRRFFVVVTLSVTAFSGTLLVYNLWAHFSQRSLFLVAWIYLCHLGAGWLLAWFFWQYYGALLQTAEKARLRSEREHVV